MEELKIGYRARIKSDRWDELNGHEVLLDGRSGKEFKGVVLKEGTNVPLAKGTGTVEDHVAWLHPDELEFVDNNLDANMDFIDWYKENEDNFCGDCGNFCDENANTCLKCGCDWGEE